RHGAREGPGATRWWVRGGPRDLGSGPDREHRERPARTNGHEGRRAVRARRAAAALSMHGRGRIAPRIAEKTLTTLLALAPCGPGAISQGRVGAPARMMPAEPPALVVFITVDQLREDYLEKYALQFTGGLARLVRGGAFFTNAMLDYAPTEAAPGHATGVCGRFPGPTGLVGNTPGVDDEGAPAVRKAAAV